MKIAHADFVVMEGQAAKVDLEDDNALEEDAQADENEGE